MKVVNFTGRDVIVQVDGRKEVVEPHGKFKVINVEFKFPLPEFSLPGREFEQLNLIFPAHHHGHVTLRDGKGKIIENGEELYLYCCIATGTYYGEEFVVLVEEEELARVGLANLLRESNTPCLGGSLKWIIGKPHVPPAIYRRYKPFEGEQGGYVMGYVDEEGRIII